MQQVPNLLAHDPDGLPPKFIHSRLVKHVPLSWSMLDKHSELAKRTTLNSGKTERKYIKRDMSFQMYIFDIHYFLNETNT